MKFLAFCFLTFVAAHAIPEAETAETAETADTADTADTANIVPGLGDTESSVRAQAGGDPHFKTWSGIKFDYHGECDLVLLDNPSFADGLGLRLHIRTTRVKYYSYIERAALQIGSDILEFSDDLDKWLLNGKVHQDKATIGGFEIRRYGKLAISVRLNNEAKARIDFYVRKKRTMHVDVVSGATDIFKGSLGLMGDHDSGLMIGRDGDTIFTEAEAYALEWQVRDTEKMLFQTTRAPQYPAVCLPPKKMLGKRLGDSHMQKAAEESCAAWKEDKESCIFDVMATRDIGASENPIVNINLEDDTKGDAVHETQ